MTSLGMLLSRGGLSGCCCLATVGGGGGGGGAFRNLAAIFGVHDVESFSATAVAAARGSVDGTTLRTFFAKL